MIFLRLSILFLCLVTGCKVEPVKPVLVETIAILPFDNESNDLNADSIMQKMVYAALVSSPYRISPLEETNAKLAQMGIIDGGQLPIMDPKKIGKDLGVQALLYGYVADFSYTNIGFYFQRKVELELTLVDVTTGEKLWENSQSAAFRTVTLDKKEAEKNFLGGLGDQVADKLFNTPLAEEAKLATIKTLSTLPGFKFAGFSDKN